MGSDRSFIKAYHYTYCPQFVNLDNRCGLEAMRFHRKEKESLDLKVNKS
jgi:hypothetical protein